MENTEATVYDVIILGSGPAGLTAAIYTTRAKLVTVIVAGTLWGGQLMLTTEVENFPGFEGGVLGPDLIEKMRKQAEKFGAEILFEDATEVDFSSHPFHVKVGERVIQGRSVIVATGASVKWLGLKSEERLRGKGVSSCATCDAAFFQDKQVVVVGGGDTALEEALALTKFAKEVTVVHRRDELRATKILRERAFRNEKIKFVWDSMVHDILGKEKVESVQLRNVKTGTISNLTTDAVFIAIGHAPNTRLFQGKLDLDAKGYIMVHEETKTSVEGVFVAGDVKDYQYRQAVTAAASGCKAALDAALYLAAQTA